jgi:uncharacterized protein YaaQ
MSVIQNFKNRQLQKAQQEKGRVVEKLAEKTASEKAENTALSLLASLLNVPQEHAISEATKYVEQNIQFYAVDVAEGKDQSVTAKIEKNDKGDITQITEVEEFQAVKDELAADLENNTDVVQTAVSDLESSAASVENSAEKVTDAANDLAYTADDITSATDALNEATAEIKKPSEEQKSSNGKKTTEPKNSSKK